MRHRALSLLGAVVFALHSFSPANAQLVRQANSTLNLPAELPSATGYTTVNAIPVTGMPGGMTFASPMCTAYPTGETNRLYVAERGGRVQRVNNLSAAIPAKNLFMDLTTYLSGQGTPMPVDGNNNPTDENGLLSMVFHPNYNQNGYFYLYFSLRVNGQLHQRLARFQATGTAGNYLAATTADPATQAPLLTIYDEAGNHNGGDLAFGADGYLYISLGDEGGGDDFYNNARFINKDFWGQMLRLDVDNRAENLTPNAHSQSASTGHPSAIHAGSYKVPADNPFIGFTSWHGLAITANTVRTEIYATGLRNPFRFTIDPPTGRIFLGDVGQRIYEEMNIIVKGGDYGWSYREGLHVFVYQNGTSATPPSSGFNPIDPIYEYDHTNDGTGNDAVVYGTSVCGGAIYRGNQMTELQGSLIFSDIYGGGGIIAALRETSPGVWTGQRLATRPQVVDFGTDPRNGELLLTSLMGTIYRLQRSGTTGTPPPALLSQTGVFSNVNALTPNTGIVPYTPNVAFWSDYAIKSRWFSVPNLANQITFNAAGNWTFPTGSVWVKHFDFDTTRGNSGTRKKLETRILVKTATDVYGLCYKWRADGSDADLVAEEGLTEAIAGASPAQTWRYPSRSECRQCHTAVGGFALSFNTGQLNRGHTYGAQTQNQIEALTSAGYFTTSPPNVNTLTAFAPASDTTQSLEWRVRSYFAVNCIQCHQPGGAAQGNWDARSSTPTDLAQIINGTLVYPGADSANRFSVPGDTAHSMVLNRLQGNGVQRMPPLGTSERDLAAEQLLTNWIMQSLPTRQSFTQWQTARFGSTGAPNAQLTADPDVDGRNNGFEYLSGSDPLVPSNQWSWNAFSMTGQQAEISFTHPANRSAIIETSFNLSDWQIWDVPGNTRFFPATDQVRTFYAPIGAMPQYFRLNLAEP